MPPEQQFLAHLAKTDSKKERLPRLWKYASAKGPCERPQCTHVLLPTTSWCRAPCSGWQQRTPASCEHPAGCPGRQSRHHLRWQAHQRCTSAGGVRRQCPHPASPHSHEREGLFCVRGGGGLIVRAQLLPLHVAVLVQHPDICGEGHSSHTVHSTMFGSQYVAAPFAPEVELLQTNCTPLTFDHDRAPSPLAGSPSW